MTLPSGLPEHITDEEELARHIFSKHHLASDPKNHLNKWARAQAFYPLLSEAPDEGWVFSVSRTLALMTDHEVQKNGLEVGKVSGRGLKGSAILHASVVREVPVLDDAGTELRKLDIVAEEKPDGSTPYHGHVIGFEPLPEGSIYKEFYKEIGETLSNRAKLNRFIRRTLPLEEWELGNLS